MCINALMVLEILAQRVPLFDLGMHHWLCLLNLITVKCGCRLHCTYYTNKCVLQPPLMYTPCAVAKRQRIVGEPAGFCHESFCDFEIWIAGADVRANQKCNVVSHQLLQQNHLRVCSKDLASCRQAVLIKFVYYEPQFKSTVWFSLVPFKCICIIFVTYFSYHLVGFSVDGGLPTVVRV